MKRTGEHARAPEDSERAEAHVPPAPSTPAGDLLALQASGGRVLRLTLKGAIVANYTQSSGGDQPTESWSLNFESVEFMLEGAEEEEGY